MSVPTHSLASTPAASYGPPPAGEREPHCPNCGTAAARNFCPECGQEMISVRLSIKDFVHEFLDDHVGWSTKVPRTLSRLLLRPGALTVDFIEGRRVRYLSPLRLYLSLSVLFFLVVANPPHWRPRTAARTAHRAHNSVSIGTDTIELDGSFATADSESTAARQARIATVDSLNADIARHLPDTTRLAGRIKARALRRNRDLAGMTVHEVTQLFVSGMVTRMPDVMFVLLPAFALFLKLLYWRRRRFYAEHFIFALHAHAVLYALITIALVLPLTFGLGALLLWFAAYVLFALRRVYGGGIVKTVLKAGVLTVTYSMLVGSAALALIGFIYLIG